MKIFLSYKSEDANTVRAVAEYLVAAGVDIWFNEFKVLLDIYDDFDRNVYDKLDEAVSTCTHAIVFTNNRWAGSDYCRKEMDSILRCIRREDVLEICIPKEDIPHQIFNDLENIDTIYGIADANLLAREIVKRFGIAAEIAAVADAEKRDLFLHRYGSYIDLGPINKPEFEKINRLYRHEPAYWHYVMPFKGQCGDKEVFLDILIRPFQTAIEKLSHPIDEPADERKTRQEYRDYALSWSREKKVEILGVHHVYINKRSHLALTCIEKEMDAGQLLWSRRYILNTFGELPIENGETHLIFSTTLSGSREEQFAAFCKLCHGFEAIACSFRQAKQKKSEIRKLSSPFLLAKVIDSGLIYLLLNSLMRNDQNEWLLMAVAFMLGLFLSDLLVFFFNPIYQKILIIMGLPLKDDFSRFPFERFMSSLSQWIYTNLFYILYSQTLSIVPFILSILLLFFARTFLDPNLMGFLSPVMAAFVLGAITGVLSSLRLVNKLYKNFIT